jgi:hypothetical protein
VVNKLILNFENNKIEKMKKLSLSLNEFARLEHLELNLNNNLLTKIPIFSDHNSNNNKSNVIKKMILNF